MALTQLVFQMGTNLEEFVEFLGAVNDLDGSRELPRLDGFIETDAEHWRTVQQTLMDSQWARQFTVRASTVIAMFDPEYVHDPMRRNCAWPVCFVPRWSIGAHVNRQRLSVPPAIARGPVPGTARRRHTRRSSVNSLSRCFLPHFQDWSAELQSLGRPGFPVEVVLSPTDKLSSYLPQCLVPLTSETANSQGILEADSCRGEASWNGNA